MTPGPGIAKTLLPKGFSASGVNCGVRRYRPDLGLVVSEQPCTAAGVFTLNQCQAAPVRYCKDLLPAENIRAIITNSGQANAATGTKGDESNLEMARAVAKELDCSTDQVLTASTGVIGEPLAIEKIVQAVPSLVADVSDRAESFATAIMTTDLVPKTVTTRVNLSGGEIHMTGICKGSGMIHPNMATMLGYVLTDAALPMRLAQHLLKEAVDVSFNMISVDGEPSTNDCVFLLANGASGVGPETGQDVALLKQAMIHLSQLLAQSIAADGEGATKLIEVTLKGVPNEEMARRVARSLTVSPLIKTAIHGCDPNWGRILARLGAEQVPWECLERMVLSLQNQVLFQQGQPQDIDPEQIRRSLRQHKIEIEIDLRSGESEARAWGCDLSKKYVEINAEYTT